MSLTDEERELVDIMKDNISKKRVIQHAEMIRQWGLEELETGEPVQIETEPDIFEDLSAEDRIEVDTIKPILQDELDAIEREEELKEIALQELEVL